MIRKYNQFMENRQDEILDKILKSGINSLTPDEKRFLDSHKDKKEEEVGRELDIKEGELPLQSDDHLFEFNMDSIEVSREGVTVNGHLNYYGSKYYGKFLFNQYKEFEYWIFEPNAELPVEQRDSDFWELDYKLDDNHHEQAFNEFTKKIYNYYVDDIDIDKELS